MNKPSMQSLPLRLPPGRPGSSGVRFSPDTLPPSSSTASIISTAPADSSSSSVVSSVDWKRGTDKRRKGSKRQLLRDDVRVSKGGHEVGGGSYYRDHASPAGMPTSHCYAYDTAVPPISRPAARQRSAARQMEATVLSCLLVVTVVATFTLLGVLQSSPSSAYFNFLGSWFDNFDLDLGGGADRITEWLDFGIVGGPDRTNERRAIAALRDAKDRHGGWPPSVRDEEAFFELLRHPGGAVDEQGRPVEIAVPRFYASDRGIDGSGNGDGGAGFFGGRLLTRRVADMVGTYVTEDGRAASNVDARTVFVSLISYRDGRCRDTLESIFARASRPERVRVGVIDQIESTDPSCDVPARPCETDPDQALCRYHRQIDVYEVEANLAVGPIFARHISQRLYRGEYYVLQIDVGTTFVSDWDLDIIDEFESAGDEMAVLSTYLPVFDAEDGSAEEETGEIGPAHHSSRYLICNAGFEGVGRDRRLRHDVSDQPEGAPHIRDSPQLQPYWSGEFSFSRGHFALTVPYDPHLAMIERPDEEISVAIRAFTHGYDFYSPERNVCFRQVSSVAVGEDGPSGEVAATKATFKEQAHRYRGKHASSISRLLALIDMGTGEDWDKTDEDKYGMGSVRASSKFFTCFGIHVGEKITERKLCDFVSSGMLHRKFLENLRDDGMGIDYKKIIFRFHELLRVHENM